MLIFVQLIVGFIVLIKCADFLVEGATSLARKLNVSDLVIGLTVVAFGTSAPELFVNIIACAKGTTDIAIGNILGSNIFNVFFILGVSAIVRPLMVAHNTAWKEIPFSLLAAVMVLILANDGVIDYSTFSALTRIDGLVLLSFFAVFMAYIFAIVKDHDSILKETIEHKDSLWKSLMFVLVGLAGLVLGGKFIVESATSIARIMGVSESLIGLTIVAAGTSLPELATSVVAARKNNADIAVGNIVGSNIFNIFFILGVSALIKPLPFNPNMNFDIVVTILSSVVLFIVLFIGKKRELTRIYGVAFIIGYLIYTWIIIQRG